MQRSDAELISACRSGEEWAWDALVDRYKGLVYSIGLHGGLSDDDASDVFQTVFALLVEHLNSIRAPQGLAAWLITTTKREAWRVHRQQRREPTDPVVLDSRAAVGEQPASARAYEDRCADRALLQEALELVGERCRRLLLLLYFEPVDLSYVEISSRLGIPLGSIGPTRARCLLRMREFLRQMGMGDA